MKSLIFRISIFLLPILDYGQESKSEIKHRIEEIDSQIKISDSIGNIQKEGISEGEIRYDHISGKFGWEAYFINDAENKNQPLRIRYSETQPKANEDLNLYYQNGILVFAELISTPISRKLKLGKSVKKYLYFNGETLIYPEIIYFDEYNYVLEKEKVIRKMIYK
jgi:hypothetical protein